MDFDRLKDEEVIHIYSDSIKELKKRNIIRTKNVLGELGEYLAISYYNKTSNLPKLQTAPIGTQNVDAMSRNGERYSIKSCSTSTTGVFYGLQPKGSTIPDKQAFEYVIICHFDDDCQLQEIYELDWEAFLKAQTMAQKNDCLEFSSLQRINCRCKTDIQEGGLALSFFQYKPLCFAILFKLN